MKQTLHVLLGFILLLGISIAEISAQVTIGAGTAPESYSVLELSTASTKGGLRLPHLTTVQRDALGFASGAGTVPNQGLTIYNNDTRCIEYWDDNKWVSLCLGSANITLTSPCGDYDKNNPPVAAADGTPSGCEYTPNDDPACTVPSGKAYDVYLTAGDSYASLSVDDLTSAFSITFSANNSSNLRNAVVRVVNNCSGEFQDFVFSQTGATCTGVADPVLNVSTLALCQSGSVYAHVTNAVAGTDYIWAYGGVVVHTGTYYEIKRSGTYKIYGGFLGCGTAATLTVADNGTVAPAAISITATNGGILCKGGNVILTANTNPGDAIEWYHGGVPEGGGANPLTLSGASAAGEWFAVVTGGGCKSSSSNVLILSDQTTGSSALAAPAMYIDGVDVSSGGTLTLCQNSGVVLEVGNAGTYPAGVFFEWFVNGFSLGYDTNSSKFYAVPSGATNLVISVQVSNQGVNCPNTAVAPRATIHFTAPNNTNINNGDSKAYVCGGAPALLVASFQGGAKYEWRLNDAAILGAAHNQYTTSVQGSYKVRYQDTKGCWSKFSPAITVENSSAISLAWSIEPGGTTGNVIYGATESYSVMSAPIAESYTWTATGSVSGPLTMHPSGNGATATITYPTLTNSNTETITITVVAQNGCGQTNISKNVSLGAGCTPVNSVNITPNGAKLTVGDKMSFTATSAGATSYQWQVNGINAGANQATYAYTATVAGTHTLSVKAEGCGGDATANVSIEVKPDLGSITEESPTGNYTISGKGCYDVNRTSSAACGSIAGRRDDFATSKTFYYTFTNTTAYTDLAFYVEDNSTVLASYSVSDKVLTVVFRLDIQSHIVQNGEAKLTVIAVYKNNTGLYRKVSKEIKVQDCSCCGAYVSATQWKVFKCHNLGANESLDPFIPVQGIHGNYYQWGRPGKVADASTSEAAISGWNTTDAANGSWTDASKTANDPCPTGFRVPTKADWDGIVTQSAKNPQTAIGTWTDSPTNFASGRQLGQGLFLPAAGFRYFSIGHLGYRGNGGYYWSSPESSPSYAYYLYFTSSSATVLYTPRTSGVSVRCVAE